MNRDLFGLLLLGVQVAINVPVIIHILRVKTGKGISLTGEMIWIAGGVGWALYGLQVGSTTLIISGLLAFLGCSIVTVLLLRYEKLNVKPGLVLSLITLMAIVVSLVVWDATGLSITLAAFGVIQFLPQLIESGRGLYYKRDATGISLSGATFRTIYAAGWAVYAGAWFIWSIGFERIDWPLVFWGLADTTSVFAFCIAWSNPTVCG